MKASVDALTERASLQVQLQKDPLKMLGGASAVGALLGVVVGRQFRRSKKIYVDATSPVKQQKALMKAQQKQKGGGVGGALVATLGTLAFKALNDKVLTPKLEEIANNMLDRAGQQPGQSGAPQGGAARPQSPAARRPAPSGGGGAASFLKRPEGGAAQTAGTPASPPASTAGAQAGQIQGYGEQSRDTAAPSHPGELPTRPSTVEAKAQGTPIAPQEKVNPNLR
nr:hypothetical protein [Deinococcus budaensis]